MAVADESLNDLLGGDDNSPDTTQKRSMPQDGKSCAKRTCLRHYDQVQHQALNAMGHSGIRTCSLESLWAMMEKGHKGAVHCSNPCFKELYRQTIGLSQMCETLQVALEQLVNSKEAEAIFEKTFFAKIKAEALSLLSHVRCLNVGPRASSQGNVTYARAAQERGDPAVVEVSAKAVYVFLNKEGSLLRALLCFLGGGGSYYVASVAEKSARAWLSVRSLDEEAFKAVAMARDQPGSSASSSKMDSRDDITILTGWEV